ncbi:hypothetical protein ACL9RL_11045 [Plantibacter sp. Mn2098]|uniref:hypothetical protein n=1 Tax=Plantibacter sp. Mn2098 TaxID=3395266 RepID=UPI003BBD7F00
MGAEFASTAEFDAFGPWVDQVLGPDDVPRLYARYPIDFPASRLVLKVPRDISRRDASPTMDLYDALLIAGTDRLTVLTRVGARFTESSVRYDRIAAISNRVNLLDAKLRLQTIDGAMVEIRYSGASERTMIGLVEILRSASPAVTDPPRPSARLPRQTRLATPPAPLELDDLGKHDVGFVTSFRDLARRELGVWLLAANGRTRLTPRGGIVSKALHAVYPMTLHGALICRSEAELHVFSRNDWLVRGGAPVLSRAHTILPVGLIDEITMHPHRDYEGVDVIVIRIGSALVEVMVPAGSVLEHALLG